MPGRFTAEQRARVVARYRASGLTQREFAEQAGISLSALRGWLYRRDPHAEPRGEPRGRFVEVVAAPATEVVEVHVGRVRIVLPAGTSVERLAAVVQALSSAEWAPS